MKRVNNMQNYALEPRMSFFLIALTSQLITFVDNAVTRSKSKYVQNTFVQASIE